MGAILDEVIGPDMVGIFRSQPDARTVVQPEPASLRLPGRHLETLLTPDPLDALQVDQPARLLQQRRDPAVSIAAIPGGELNDVGR